MSKRETEANEAELVERLNEILHATAPLMHVMRIARRLGLPDWLVFLGAIYQPVLMNTEIRRCAFRLGTSESLRKP